MQKALIKPAALRGAVTPPVSKSAAHRAMICASLAAGESAIAPFSPSDDMRATLGAIGALGVTSRLESGTLFIRGLSAAGGIPEVSGAAASGAEASGAEATIDCLESGSTLRFLIPVAAALGRPCVFIGRGRLPTRPVGPYLSCLPGAGAVLQTEGGLPLRLCGRLRTGVYRLPGDVSSQFVTGLLLALPLLDGDSRIALTSPLQSAGYVTLTRSIMRDFGVETRPIADGWLIPGGQQYQACPFKVEGDWSQAAFWLAAGALGGPVACRGLRPDSAQGDREIVPLLRRFGAHVESGGGTVTVSRSELRGIEIDARQIPDLVPILAVLACFARGRTVIRGAERLRLKESDRLHAMARGLTFLGASAAEREDGLVIDGSGEEGPSGGEADGAGDHRIVMALSIAAAHCRGGGAVTGSGSVAKSYPGFFEDFSALGGECNVIDVG